MGTPYVKLNLRSIFQGRFDWVFYEQLWWYVLRQVQASLVLSYMVMGFTVFGRLDIVEFGRKYQCFGSVCKEAINHEI